MAILTVPEMATQTETQRASCDGDPDGAVRRNSKEILTATRRTRTAIPKVMRKTPPKEMQKVTRDFDGDSGRSTCIRNCTAPGR
jgi:hypothetical protein